MLRFALLLIGLTALAPSAQAGEKFAGLLTFGCGDRYLTRPGATQTWAVNMSPTQHREMIAMTGFDLEFLDNTPWMTFQVEFAARQRLTPKQGFFNEHVGQLDVEYVIAAGMIPPTGDSVDDAAPARTLTGYLTSSFEFNGFVALSHKEEFLWLISGKDNLLDHIPSPYGPKAWPLALVEIVVRVGPPGAYGHLSGFDREAAVDGFRFIRLADADELEGTALVVGEDGELVRPAYTRCIHAR